MSCAQPRSALKVAQDLGYPLTLYTENARHGIHLEDADSLRASWTEGSNRYHVIQPAQYTLAPRVRVSIVAERAFRSMRLRRGRWHLISLRQAPCDLAIAACRELQVDVGVVDLALVDGEPVVLRVTSRAKWMVNLSEVNTRSALHAIAGSLRQRVQVPAPVRRGPARPHLTVLMARDYNGSGSGYRIGNIQALITSCCGAGTAFLHFVEALIRTLSARQTSSSRIRYTHSALVPEEMSSTGISTITRRGVAIFCVPPATARWTSGQCMLWRSSLASAFLPYTASKR